MKIKTLVSKEQLLKLKKSMIDTSKKWSKQTVLYVQDKFNDYRVARGTSGYQLSPLYPTIEKKHHAQYVSSLNRAAKDNKVRNLALTGHYGSGKSSILEWFIKNKKRKVVRISFSTLGANIEKYITTNDGDPKAKRLGVLSNLIQKEIVKHILFNDQPSSLPNSRYKRAAKPNKLSTLLLSLWIAVILSFIAYVMGFNTFVESLSLRMELPTTYIWAMLGVFTWLSVAIVLFIGGSKIKLDKVTGGPFSLSLSGETSYFDEYLDEIIYYFQATGRRIVIIEDIDRFNTLYIFENLRQLNTILNNSKQIRGRVLFVYAIKDSVFVQNTFDDNTEDSKEAKDGAATAVVDELAEAQESDSQSRVTNRTKFFDLIIPVVPFITISSSRMFIKNMLGKINHNVSDGLIEAVAKHVNDMRLIKNMYNEFVVFKDKVVTDSGIDSLHDDGLFALVAYKNTYLADFENIKDGTSVLDDVHALQRNFVGERSREVTGRIAELDGRLSSNSNLEKTARGFGETLLKYVDDVAAQTGASVTSYNFDGKAYSADEIKALPFWEELSKADLTAEFIVSHNPINYRFERQQTITKAFITSELVGSVDLATLKATEVQSIKDEIEVLKVEQKELLHLDIAELMLNYEEKFLPRVEKALNDGRLFDPRLALDLLKSGYIDSNYILYTSVYHKDGMSPNAANFAIQFIQREDQQDIYYDLDPKDIKQLLKENISYIDERSMYNISIVDYLVTTHPIDRRTRAVLANIGTGKYNADEFIKEYVSNTKHLSKFIARITREWSGVFEFIVKSNLIKPKQRNALISTALVNTDARKEYDVDDEVTQYIVGNASEISALKTSTKQNEVDSIKHVLKKLNARFELMDSLSAKVKRAVIDSGLYVINANNLKLILGSEDYSLDAIKKAHEGLYANILSHFGEYITMLDSLKVKQFSIKGEQGFEEIINDVSSNANDSLGELLDRANLADCVVDELHKLKRGAWIQSIQHVIVSNTFGNTLDYYDYAHSGGEPVDATLGTYLNEVGTLTLDSSMDTRDAATKDTLIMAILNSPNVLAEVKANIVKDCYNGTYVNVSEITPQEGVLYGELLKNGSIEDTAENINQISELAWDTRKHYIDNSSELLTYINEVEWKADDIDGVASSSDLDELKQRMIVDIENYKDMLSYTAAANFIEYAYAQRMQLPSEVLATLFSKAGSLRDEAAIGLVNLIPESDVTIANITQPLAKLGEPYVSLTKHLRRPKLANEAYNQTLVGRLEKLGMVSKKETISDGRQIRVNMKRDW